MTAIWVLLVGALAGAAYFVVAELRARRLAAVPKAPALPKDLGAAVIPPMLRRIEGLVDSDRDLLAYCKAILEAYTGEQAGTLLGPANGRYALVMTERAFLAWPVVRELALARAPTSGVPEDGRIALLGAAGAAFWPEVDSEHEV